MKETYYYKLYLRAYLPSRDALSRASVHVVIEATGETEAERKADLESKVSEALKTYAAAYVQSLVDVGYEDATELPAVGELISAGSYWDCQAIAEKEQVNE